MNPSSGNIIYYLCYDTPIGQRPDGSFVRRVGKQTLEHDKFDLDMNKGVCDSMISIFGHGTHWIEDETGEKVYSGEEAYYV